MATPINLKIYDSLCDDWWSDLHFMALLRLGVNPLRVEYMHQHIPHLAPYDQCSLLDIGCGGGFFTESCAALGMDVAGIDPSPQSITTAKKHAQNQSLEIKYFQRPGEETKMADNCFDVVSCFDVLEHVRDPIKLVQEAFRVLKPGGVFIYDTINRTVLSYIGSIYLAQNCPLTAFMPRNVHVWDKFITPKEMHEFCLKSGFVQHHQMGIVSHAMPWSTLINLYRQKKGLIDFPTLAKRLQLSLGRNMQNQYIGHALKPIETA